MPWEAPNLLDKIFREPDVADNHFINDFMGGFLARSDRNAQRKEQSGGDGASFEAGGGGASGDAGGSSGGPGSSTTGASATDTSWASDWMRATLEGQQMSKNILAYNQAVTSTKMNQANMAGQILQNQGLQRSLSDTTEDHQTVAEWLKDKTPDTLWNTPAPYLKTSQARLAIADMQKTAASTLFAQSKIEYQKNLISQATTLQGEGFDIPIDQQTGLPDPKAVAAAGQQSFERKRKLEMDRVNAITDRQLSILDTKDSDTRERQLAVVNARGQWNMDLLKQKESSVVGQAGKMLNSTLLAAFKEKMIAVRTDPTLSSEQKAQKMDSVIDEFGLKGKLRYTDPAAQPTAQPGGNSNDPLGLGIVK